jgi:phosphoglycolate phosphatase-like HAD superfamily hydrolase
LPSASPAIESALDAVVLDFDGVILESVDVKTEAFRALFVQHPGELDAIVDLHERHGGASRYVKFDMIYRDILKQPLAAAEREQLGRRYAQLVVDRVLACPMVPGARDLLDRLHGRVPMAVVSGTPDAELATIIARRGLDRYFVAAHGSSREKRAIIADMVRARGWRAARTIMVGDAMTDHDAACANGVGFIGRVAAGRADPFPVGTNVISDLHGFAAAAAGALALRGATA